VLGIGGLLSLVGVSVLIAVVLVLGLRNDQMTLNDRSVPYANAIAVAALNAKGIANDERGYLITGDSRFTAQIPGRVRTARAAFATAANAAHSPAQYRAAVQAQAGFERWLDSVRAHVAGFRAGDRRRSTQLALGPGRALRKRYETSLAEAQTHAAEAIEAGRASVEQEASRSLRILIASLLVATAFGLVITWWLIRLILHPIYAMLTVAGETRPPTTSAR
jgi:methyl-accepting chemotaxis protein